MDKGLYDALTSVFQRPVAFHPILAEIGGGAVPGLFLSQAIYWTPRTKDGDGWFHKTQVEWESEIKLTRSEQETARRKLLERGLIEEELKGVPARMYYRVNLARVYEEITGVPADKDEENPQTSLQEISKQDSPKPTNTIRKAETTTETTQVTGPRPDPVVAAIVEACGYTFPLLDVQLKRVTKVLPELRKIKATDEEVRDWRRETWPKKGFRGDPYPSQVSEGVIEHRQAREANLASKSDSLERDLQKVQRQTRIKKAATGKQADPEVNKKRAKAKAALVNAGLVEA